MAFLELFTPLRVSFSFYQKQPVFSILDQNSLCIYLSFYSKIISYVLDTTDTTVNNTESLPSTAHIYYFDLLLFFFF